MPRTATKPASTVAEQETFPEPALEAPVIPAIGPAALAALPDADFELRMQVMSAGRRRLERIQRELLVRGEDYGEIPGTNKPTLLKPGAERLCEFYGLHPSFDYQLSIGDGLTTPHLRYEVKCRLHVESTAGPVVAEGLGAANSFEKRHRYRGTTSRDCPSCGRQGTIRKGSERFGGGWFCSRNQGGCGRNFDANDPGILSQQASPLENMDPWDLANTLLKVAEKRALVDATLHATATSGLFTQDLEEYADSPERAAAHVAPPAPVTAPAAPPARPAAPARQRPVAVAEPQPTTTIEALPDPVATPDAEQDDMAQMAETLNAIANLRDWAATFNALSPKAKRLYKPLFDVRRQQLEQQERASS